MTTPLDAPGIRVGAEHLIALRRVALSADADAPLAALPGGFVTRRRGHGQDVADMREYVAGDDIRHLDRGTTARTGTLHVRRFQEERDRVTLLIADFRPAMLWGTRRALRSVAAAEILAMIGWRVVEEGGRVGLLALGAGAPVLVPLRGRTRGMLEVIGGLVRAHEAALQLALAGETGMPPLDAGLSRTDRIAPRGAEVVIASGFDEIGAGFRDRMDALSRNRAVRLVAVEDRAARRLPKGNYPIRMPGGARRMARVAGAEYEDERRETIVGRVVLTLDAGAAPDLTARRIAAAFPPDREP